MAEQFQAITGANAEQSKFYMEMAGQNLEAAISFFFEGGGAMPMEEEVSSSSPPPDVARIVWENPSDPIPDSWSEQTLALDPEHFGFVQPKNGPCGILAVLQASMIARRFKQNGCCIIDNPFTVDDLILSLSECLWKCRNPTVTGVLWTDESKMQLQNFSLSSLEEVNEFITANIDIFQLPGGLILFIYAAVLSRGMETVAAEAELPLIVGPFRLCTTDLMSLLMRGNANGNVGAFTQTGGQNTWPDSEYGLISKSEIDTSIPIADALKFPVYPIWIVHGGDHFTVIFCQQIPDNESFELYHWNGLPPGGPRMSKINIVAPEESSKAPATHQPSYIKPIPGEIEDINQANPEDKEARPEECETWHYECILAIDDPSVQGVDPPADYIPHLFELGNMPSLESIWTCAACFRTRFQTYRFGRNQGTNVCSGCGISKESAGWGIWLHYDDLPKKWQRKMVRRYAPKVVPILWTRWPGCQIDFNGEKPSV